MIVVDIDKNELSKQRGLKLFLKINEILSNFFDVYNLKYKQLKFYNNDWLKKCLYWKNKYPIIEKSYFSQKKYVNVYVFFHHLSKLLNKNSIIITDSGGNLTWTMQAFKIKKGQK